MKCFYFLIAFFLIAFPAYAAEDVYQFNSPQEKIRFQNLTTELRCLVCQNQNLAESNAPLAADLRGEIYHKIQQGQSDLEIINYLVARYGDFILYKPSLSLKNIALWVGPSIFLLVGIAGLLFYVGKNRVSDELC